MHKSILIVIAAIALASCSETQDTKSFKSNDLIGVWELKFDGVYPYWFSQIGFTRDGKKCVLSYEFDANGQVSIDYYLNTYKVENGYLYSDVGFSSTPYVRSGQVIKDRIDILEKDYLEVFMVGPLAGSTAEKHQRLNGISPNEICRVVENYRSTSHSSGTVNSLLGSGSLHNSSKL